GRRHLCRQRPGHSERQRTPSGLRRRGRAATYGQRRPGPRRPPSGGSNAPFVTSPNLNLTALQQLFAAEAAFLSQQVLAQARQEFSQRAVDPSLLDELFETWLALP